MKILITGASRGLGYAMGMHFLNAGHDVIGCARSAKNHCEFTYISGIDLENPSSFALLENELITCDALINNAAMANDALLMLQGEKIIEKIIKINLSSTLILCKRYIRARAAQKLSGNIINISSISAHRSIKGLTAYAASKAGLEMASKILAREVGPLGFRVNCVSPGYLETEMSQNISQEYKDIIASKTPLEKLSSCEDIIHAVEFLLFENSKFITGQNIIVDGGFSC